MQENARLILGLQALGLSDADVVNFLLWMETGDDRYKPHRLKADSPVDTMLKPSYRTDPIKIKL